MKFVISNILVLGESGTGKGVLASFFHKSRKGKNAPFVQINCAALPEALLESELFGYERGAFTGAREQGKIGLFEMANGGTLFLDEIGELPLSLQAKLLTYLDNNEIMPWAVCVPERCIVPSLPLQTAISRPKWPENAFGKICTIV